MSGAWPYHFVCDVVLLLVFHGFVFLLSCCYFLLCLRALGIGLGKRKVNGAWGKLNETQRVKKDLDEA